jgi:hypothetical protein
LAGTYVSENKKKKKKKQKKKNMQMKRVRIPFDLNAPNAKGAPKNAQSLISDASDSTESDLFLTKPFNRDFRVGRQRRVSG